MNKIACGKCSHWSNKQHVQVHHDSIEAIRNCRGPIGSAPLPADFDGSDYTAEKRAEDFRDLSQRKSANAAGTVDVWAKVRALQASLLDLAHMRYAIEVLDFEKSESPVWKFYQIDKPRKGRWAGRTFVNVMASDERYPVRHPEALITLLTAIAEHPAKAASNYGHQIGKCGICHRTLTNANSIARGIGPTCADKAGW